MLRSQDELNSYKQGYHMFLTRSSQALFRKEPKWQVSSQTLCLRFDVDVTIFTQPWYDLFAKLAKWLAANMDKGPSAPWVRPWWCNYKMLLWIQYFFVKVDDKQNIWHL